MVGTSVHPNMLYLVEISFCTAVHHPILLALFQNNITFPLLIYVNVVMYMQWFSRHVVLDNGSLGDFQIKNNANDLSAQRGSRIM